MRIRPQDIDRRYHVRVLAAHGDPLPRLAVRSAGIAVIES
jgi:hypothetical protein